MASVFNVRNLVWFNSVCLQLFQNDITRSVYIRYLMRIKLLVLVIHSKYAMVVCVLQCI